MTNKTKTLALLPILAFVLTACSLSELPVVGGLFGGGEESSEEAQTTITVWGLWEDPDVMDELIAKYNESYPNVTVNYEDRSVMPLIDYKERTFSRFTGEEASDVDIALVHNSWVSRLSPVLSEMPSSYINFEGYTEKYYPVITESGVVDDKVYATPAYYDGLVLVYNKEHFEEINQTAPPTAWEEFRRLALELTDRGEDGSELLRGGAAVGTADNIAHFSDILSLMWAQADVGVSGAMQDKTNYGVLEQYNNLVSEIDTRPAYDALTFYTNFVKEDKVWSESLPEATTAFANGQVSMIFVPAWQVLDIITAMPNADSVGVAPVPQAIPQEPRTWGTFWMYAIPANTTKQDAAWSFLDFLSQNEQQLMLFDSASQVRPFGPVYSSVDLSAEVESSLLIPVVDTAHFAKSSEFASRSGNRKQEDALKDAVNSVLSEKETSEEALTRVKEDLE